MVGGVARGEEGQIDQRCQAEQSGNGKPREQGNARSCRHCLFRAGRIALAAPFGPEAQDGHGLARTGQDGEHGRQRQAKGEMAIFVIGLGAREHHIGQVGQPGRCHLDAQRADRTQQSGLQQSVEITGYSKPHWHASCAAPDEVRRGNHATTISRSPYLPGWTIITFR